MDLYQVDITKQAEQSMRNIALYIAQNLGMFRRQKAMQMRS